MRKSQIISLFVISFLYLSCSSTGEVSTSASNYEEVPMPDQAVSDDYPEPDMWAKYPGGNEALQKYIQMNTRIPEAARIEGYNGRLVIMYVVDREGEASMAEVLMSPHKAITSMYEKLIKNMERWEPAVLNDEPVEQRYIITALFNDSNSQ